jgi:putative phosphoesterase
MRVGVIADNHSRAADGSDLPQSVLDAFAGVDLIVHCGDAGSWGTLDRLATVAPVIAVLGGDNGRTADPRVHGDRYVTEIGGRRVGIVHDLVGQKVMTQTNPKFEPASPDLRAAMRAFFGEDVDVILYAGTHVPRIGQAAGIFWVNGGSATIPLGRPEGSPGTVAVADFDDAMVSARIIDLA